MKTLRIILALILTLFTGVMSAQNVMVIEKNDGSTIGIKANDIKEVRFAAKAVGTIALSPISDLSADGGTFTVTATCSNVGALTWTCSECTLVSASDNTATFSYEAHNVAALKKISVTATATATQTGTAVTETVSGYQPSSVKFVITGGTDTKVLYENTLKDFNELYDMKTFPAEPGIILDTDAKWGGSVLMVFIPNEQLSTQLKAYFSDDGVNWSLLRNDEVSPIEGYELYYGFALHGSVKLVQK